MDDLDRLLQPLPEKIGGLCRSVVSQLAAMPDLSGTVKFGWRSINFRHARAGLICAVFPHEDRVAIYFEQGRLLEDPEGLLEGDHLKKGRFMRLCPGDAVPEAGLAMLVGEAIALSSGPDLRRSR
ncbi:DUF1801 domain-containing protein [uncultured Devosia sp.]|uniref:DUF1801 domain-containing protein n=1 Tax=uncultured Devosia sp. TaxID=211434 RepID=UPI00261695CC|nr:DUF1801 domain-containing protein [uncultured Devosia sp.]